MITGMGLLANGRRLLTLALSRADLERLKRERALTLVPDERSGLPRDMDILFMIADGSEDVEALLRSHHLITDRTHFTAG